MKKSNLLLVLYITIFQIGITANAQKVTNITFRQEQSTIIVSYDLQTKTPCKVNLHVSTNGGTSWQGPLIKVTGDVGSKVVSGNHNITWKVLEEFDELKGNNIKFQVRVSDEVIKTVTIGTQDWMVKNLDVFTYRNGDIIPEVKDPDEWKNLTTGAWCYYNNDPKNDEVYGKLYNWYAVNDPRCLAPEGFHVPAEFEMNMVTDFKNINGFAGLPGGFRGTSKFVKIGTNGAWWSSTEVTTSNAYNRDLMYDSGNIYSFDNNKIVGFSVRCIKD